VVEKVEHVLGVEGLAKVAALNALRHVRLLKEAASWRQAAPPPANDFYDPDHWLAGFTSRGDRSKIA